MSNKMVIIFLLLFGMVLFVSCGNTENTDVSVTIIPHTDEMYYPDTENVMVIDTYYEVKLSDEDAASYPKLKDALDKHNSDLMAQVEEEKKELSEAALSAWGSPEDSIVADGFFEYETNHTFSERECSVMRADSRYTSLRVDYMDYYAGAHGYYCVNGVTFDNNTGEEIALSKIVVNDEKFKDVASKKVRAFFENQIRSWGDDPESEPYVDSINERENAFKELIAEGVDSLESWVLTPEGIVFFLNPYTIASYAEGMQVIGINYSEAPDVFDEMFFVDAPKSYELSLGRRVEVPAYIDTDMDGISNQISVYSKWEHDDKYTIVIEIDDNKFDMDTVDGFNRSAFIKKDENGKITVNYVVLSDDYQEVETYIYEITDNVPNKL